MIVPAEIAAPLLTGEYRLAGESHDHSWYAVYTKSRHEQLVRKQLEGKGIANFLPVYEKTSQWKDRTKRITLPLFPGYLFVKILWHERLEVLKAFGVVHIVGDGYHPQPIPEEQILNILAFRDNGFNYESHPYLNEGNKIRIVDGPLAGLEGILVRKKNQSRLVVSVDLIQRSVSVEIDSWKIERI
jgi:transcriptional antiterminator NusG